MIELTAPAQELRRFTLVEEERVTKGHITTSSEDVKSWIELAVPAVTPLTKNLIGKDGELLAFYKAERGRYAYDWVALGCSFSPVKGESFKKAWFETRLYDDIDNAGLMVWSMDPLEAYDSVKVKRSGKLAAEFKLVSAEVSSEVERASKDWCLRAYALRTCNPYWEFRHTASSPLDGYWPLGLVVRRPVGAQVSGMVTLRAEIKKSVFAIFGTNKDTEASGLTFNLG